MQGEKASRVDEGSKDPPSSVPRQVAEASDGVFVGTFRMDGLTRAELEAIGRNRYAMGAPSLQMHLDPAFGFVVNRPMLEKVRCEGSAKFPVDARENVEIESGRNALRVIIGGDQNI